MIFCAVIVCLMAIMYQANESSNFYPGALDGVTAVVMITIVFAIICASPSAPSERVCRCLGDAIA